MLCRDNAAPADGLMERVLRLERIVEQIGCVLLPQNMKDIVEGEQPVPEMRVQNSVVRPDRGCSSAPDFGADRGWPHNVPHGTACRIVLWNRLWIRLCLRSWRQV